MCHNELHRRSTETEKVNQFVCLVFALLTSDLPQNIQVEEGKVVCKRFETFPSI